MGLSRDRILGVDPGTNILGYGVIEIRSGEPKVLACSVLKLKSLPDHPTKLKEIFLQMQEIIETYQTGILSIELPFFAKDPQAMLKLGRAQGVAMAAGIVMDLEIHEFSATQIKKSVTGNGNASKEQVLAMITRLLNYQIESSYLDASDALAAAYCYHAKSRLVTPSTRKTAGNWSAFIRDNPDRIA